MIKVTVSEQKTQSKKPFPKLMISRSEKGSTIVFVLDIYGEGNGIYSDHPLWNDKPHSFYKTMNWDLNEFTDFNEPITLQNA